METTSTQRVLSLYPNVRGFGYACIEFPEKLIDDGLAIVRPKDNKKLLQRVKVFLEYYQPTVVTIRNCELPKSAQTTRSQMLIEEIIKYTKELELPVFTYTREQVQDFFEVKGIKTKEQIAKQIIIWFEELKRRTPRIRKPWMDEDYNMGVFDAIALAITHQSMME